MRQGCQQFMRNWAWAYRACLLGMAAFVAPLILNASDPSTGAKSSPNASAVQVAQVPVGQAQVQVGQAQVQVGQAQVQVHQAQAMPGTVVHGNAIPQGWTPQAVPYQAVGPDGRPVTMHYAPTYVFTYPIGPPVAAAPAVQRASQVNRRQAYGRPGVTPQGFYYQSQGALPSAYVLPQATMPATVTRYQPSPYQFPAGAAALGGTPLKPPQMPAAPAVPAELRSPYASPAAALPPPPTQWVPAPADAQTSPGQAFSAGSGVAASSATVAGSAAAAQGSPPLVAQPVSSAATQQTANRPANSHRWRVVGVHDGDTVTCLDDANQQQKVRLAEIDAPELGQDFGKVSRDALAEMVFGKTIEVVDDGKDRYGRWIGHLVVNGQDANRQMVATGNAWHYAAYSKDGSLSTLQSQAQAQQIGLWSQKNPTPPWDYRKNGKTKTKP
ncbi:MAG: thermonuclease family protein [Planctomycetota bacterium]